MFFAFFPFVHFRPFFQAYMEQAQELVRNENILLQTLGFDVAIDHPHTHVVKCCQLVKASKELAQTSYFMATNRYTVTGAGTWLGGELADICWIPLATFS